MPTNFDKLTPEQKARWNIAVPIFMDYVSKPKQTLDLANAYGVPQQDVRRAVARVLKEVPWEEIEEIFFEGMCLLIVERFGKPDIEIPFDFEREGFGQIVIDAKETNYGNKI